MKISINHIIALIITIGIVVFSSCSSDLDPIVEPKDTFISITDTIIIDNTLRITKESETLYNSNAAALLCNEFFIGQEETALILMAGGSITIDSNNLAFNYVTEPDWMLVVILTELDSTSNFDAYLIEKPSGDIIPGPSGLTAFSLETLKAFSILTKVEIDFFTNRHMVGRFEFDSENSREICNGLFAVEFITGC